MAMKKIWLAGALALLLPFATAGVITGVVNAQVVTFGFNFSWDDPTERTDGTDFFPEEIDRYVLSCVSVTQEAEIEVPRSEAMEGEFEWLDAVDVGGFYDCKMKVVDVEGLESDWSNTVTVRRVARPMPPVLRGE